MAISHPIRSPAINSSRTTAGAVDSHRVACLRLRRACNSAAALSDACRFGPLPDLARCHSSAPPCRCPSTGPRIRCPDLQFLKDRYAARGRMARSRFQCQPVQSAHRPGRHSRHPAGPPIRAASPPRSHPARGRRCRIRTIRAIRRRRTIPGIRTTRSTTPINSGPAPGLLAMTRRALTEPSSSAVSVHPDAAAHFALRFQPGPLRNC